MSGEDDSTLSHWLTATGSAWRSWETVTQPGSDSAATVTMWRVRDQSHLMSTPLTVGVTTTRVRDAANYSGDPMSRAAFSTCAPQFSVILGAFRHRSPLALSTIFAPLMVMSPP